MSGSASVSSAEDADSSPVRPQPGSAVDTPLVHFVGFLLLTLQRPAGPLLGLLLRKYDTALKRDPEFHRLVFAAASRFYGAAAAQQAFGMGAGSGGGGAASAAPPRGGSSASKGIMGLGSGMPPGFLDMARSMAARRGGGQTGSKGGHVETLD